MTVRAARAYLFAVRCARGSQLRRGGARSVGAGVGRGERERRREGEAQSADEQSSRTRGHTRKGGGLAQDFHTPLRFSMALRVCVWSTVWCCVPCQATPVFAWQRSSFAWLACRGSRRGAVGVAGPPQLRPVREAPWQGLRRARGIAATVGARGYLARGRATFVGANAARRQSASWVRRARSPICAMGHGHGCG